MKNYNPMKMIRECDDEEFLIELIDKVIPRDEELLASGANMLLYKMQAQSQNISVEQVINGKAEGIAKIKAVATKRLNEIIKKKNKK